MLDYTELHYVAVLLFSRYDINLIEPVCSLVTVWNNVYCPGNGRLQSSMRSNIWLLFSCLLSHLSCLKSFIDVFHCDLVWEMSEMIWINFASFISASWGILITCLVCFRVKQFKCPLCPLRHFLSFWQRTREEQSIFVL